MFVIILVMIVCLYLFDNFYFKRRNLPPGPTPLPILGNLIPIIMVESPEEIFIEWKKTYGNIYTYWIGNNPIVAFNNFESIQEYFKKMGDVFAGRQNLQDFHKVTRGGTLGIIDTDEDLWREQRRFALHVLRKFGLGKNLMQQRILEEVTYLIKIFKDKSMSGLECEIAENLDVSIGSIINFILFGYRFSNDNLPEFRQLKLLLANLFEEMGNPIIFPTISHPRIFQHLPWFGKALKKLHNQHEMIFQFFSRQIQEHIMLNLENNAEPTNFVEAFLQESKKHKLEKSDLFSQEQLMNVCFDLWVAGQETTSTTLTWGVLYMIKNLEAQKKLQLELDTIIGGTEKLITISDRPQLPYTNAVIAEIQRNANLVPQNLVHRITEDVKVGDYLLPKNCLTVPQISVVLYDEQFLPGDGLPQMTRRFGGTAQCPNFKCIIKPRTL